MSVLIRNY